MLARGLWLAVGISIMTSLSSWAQQTESNPATASETAPDNAAARAAAVGDGQLPEGFQDLTPDHQAYIERLLEYWEKSSTQIKRCECDFQRWDYDASVLAKRDPADNRLIAHRVVRGTIRYAAPDQAQYQTTEVWSYQNPEAENPYVLLSGDGDKEKWICDGQAIYSFDFAERRLYESKIPPDQAGSGLLDSPLPFLFGANKQQILNRFWLKVVTPQGVENEYWLVAVPKRQTDAQTYSKVEIILAQEDFLPRSLHIYSVNYDPTASAVSQAIVFSNRKINSHLSGVQDFLNLFVRPHTPPGWERVDALAEAGIPGQIPGDRTGTLLQGSNRK